MGHLLKRYLEIEFSDDQIKGYLHHFAYFTIFSLLLTIFNTLLVDIQSPWWLWIVFFWGIAMLVHFFLIIKNAQKRHFQKTMNRDGSGKDKVGKKDVSKEDVSKKDVSKKDVGKDDVGDAIQTDIPFPKDALSEEAPSEENGKNTDNMQKDRPKTSREKNS
ncbi:MAG: 2TM domain-containing protein [Spirochaetales bacterium]|nr:2TM domain-containing protein [Spirochaetales bacterium]